MEKAHAMPPSAGPPPVSYTGAERHRRRWAVRIVAAILFLAVYWHVRSPPTWQTGQWGHGGSPGQSRDPNGVPDWDNLKSSVKLEWEPCYRSIDELFCARLTVPLDYSRPLNESSDRQKAHIALVLLPGRGHSASGNWSDSPLLVNPGGPGGSGVALVVTLGRSLQAIVGPDRDVIGFDPRGIGGSRPIANCFMPDTRAGPPDEPAKLAALLHRQTWQLAEVETGLANSSSTATEMVVLRSQALTKLCHNQNPEDNILRHAGTPNVAQDMLSIVRAWDKWTSDTAGHHVKCHAEEQAPLRDALESKPESTRGKLVYWGFSYGTVLGATFAAMFPESVGRMVLDGVVHTDEWYQSNSWLNAAQDMDKVVAKFIFYCHEAGERCALYRDKDEVDDVQQRYDMVLADLLRQPRSYIHQASNMPYFITYSEIKSVVLGFTYVPTFFPSLALLLDLLYRQIEFPPLVPVDLSSVCWAQAPVTGVGDGQLAVLCNDQKWKPKNTRGAHESLLTKMSDVSFFGDALFKISTLCTGWEFESVDPPSMDWKLFPLADNAPVNTSFPLLFISNTLDPITPKRSGLFVARNFRNAGFVEQISEGHCSIASTSLCTLTKIRAYFDQGLVPPPPQFGDKSGKVLDGNWTTCKVDAYPWQTTKDRQKRLAALSAEDKSLFHHAEDLNRKFAPLISGIHVPDALKPLLGLDEHQIQELLTKGTVG